jgi:hypothetical protein
MNLELVNEIYTGKQAWKKLLLLPFAAACYELALQLDYKAISGYKNIASQRNVVLQKCHNSKNK